MTGIEEKQEKSDGGSRCSQTCRTGIAEPCVDGQTAEEGPQRVACVEAYLRHGRAEHFASSGILQQKHLLRRGYAEEAGRAEEQKAQRRRKTGSQQKKRQQAYGHDSLHPRRYDRRSEADGKPAAQRIAQYHARPGKSHDQRHLSRFQTGNPRQKRRDIAVPAEHASVAQNDGQKDEPGLNTAEKAELEASLSSGSMQFEELQKASERISEIMALLDEKETRWLELSC